MRQCFTSFFMYHELEFELVIYQWRMVSSSLSISVDKQMYSRHDEAFGKIYNFQSCECEQCKNVTALGFVTRPSLNQAERLPICSNHDENYYRWQQMLNGQYIKMSVNGTSMICRFVSTAIKQQFDRCDA